MKTENIWKEASRTYMKLRFSAGDLTPRLSSKQIENLKIPGGMMTAERLWELNDVQLEALFQEYNSRITKCGGESLLGMKSKEDKCEELRVALIRDVFETKKAEAVSKMNEAVERQEAMKNLGKLERLAEQKEFEGMGDMSLQEIQIQIAAEKAKL